MKYSEFKRWLEKQGVKFKPGKGSHLHVELNGNHSDISFAHSVGDDEAEALLNAETALVTAFEICEEKREAIPMPSAAEPGQALVTLPVIVAGKVALYNAMLSESKRKADMARMLNIAPTLVDRLLSFRHKSRIEQIETALAVLGKRLVVGVM